MKTYRYYDLVMAAFVAVLLCSGLIGAPKVGDFFGISFGAAVIFFPFSYIFGDILTEVYGYGKTRRVVWAGFLSLIFASLMSYAVVLIPPAASWKDQAAYETVFLPAPRIAISSLIAYLAGEFVNSYVLAKMKVYTRGKMLPLRTIGSTVIGQAVDSLIFYPLAFLGTWNVSQVVHVMIMNYFIKVMVEILFTPVTIPVVRLLKKVENEDYFDEKTNFTPFSLK